VYTRLILAARIRLSKSLGYVGKDGMLLWAAFVGVIGGISSVAFRKADEGLKWLLTGHSQDIVTISKTLTPEMRILIPTVGGVLAGLALVAGSKFFRGMRSQDYLEVIRLGDGVISFRPTLARLLSSLLSISSGASIGREGGMVQLSALMASAMGRFFIFSRPKLRLIVACGGAAGIASAYNAPLAGALFVAEIVLQSLAIEALGPLIVASLAAALTARHWVGAGAIFALPETNTPANFELLPLLGLGIISGVMTPLILNVVDQTKKGFQALRLPIPLSLGLGGFLLGLISLKAPEVWGNGSALVYSLLTQSPTLDFVLLMLAMKLLATLVSVGSGAVGGIFTPTLFIGATVGWLYSYQLQAWFPGLSIDSVTYAALGMGAFLSGASHAPVMAILMIFEMTLDAKLVLPLILVAMTARYLSATIRPSSVYTQSLGEVRARLPYLMQVTDLQVSPAFVVNEEVSSERVSEIFCFSTTQQIWVVDAKGCYLGAISLQNMKQFLGDSNLKHLSAALVFMEDDIPMVTPDTALTDALAIFGKTSTERLPVVGADRKLLGEITKTDVLLTLS